MSMNLRRRPVDAIPFLATAWLAVGLAPELAAALPAPNDHVFHHGLALEAARWMEHPRTFADPWVDLWAPGYPVFHHYHHLPHLAVAAVAKATGISVLAVFLWVHYLSLALMPLSVARMTAALRFPRTAVAAASCLALAASSTMGYGQELPSYASHGSGLWTQALGVHALALFFPRAVRAAGSGGGAWRCGLLLALCLATHVFVGLLGAVAVAAAALAAPPWRAADLAQRAARVVAFGAAAGVVLAYHLVPMVLDGASQGTSGHDPGWKYDGFGVVRTAGDLAAGDLFDARSGFPLLTALVLGGALAALRRPRGGPRAALAAFAACLLLLPGRGLWGPLLDVLPLARGIHFHRFVLGVHVFALPLAGLAVHALAAIARRRLLRPATASALRTVRVTAPAILLVAVAARTADFLAMNGRYVRDAAAPWRAPAGDGADLEAAFAAARAHLATSPGRIYLGKSNGWGGTWIVGEHRAFLAAGGRGLPSFGFFPHSWSVATDPAFAFDDTRAAHHRLFNVQAVVGGDATPPGGTLLSTHGRHRVHAMGDHGWFELVDAPLAVAATVPGATPLMVRWMATDWVEAGDHVEVVPPDAPCAAGQARATPEDPFTWRLDPDVAAGGAAPPPRTLFAPAPEGGPAPGAAPLFDAVRRPLAVPRGEVLAEWTAPGDHVCVVRVDRPCLLLLKQSHHSGWRATVDGLPAAVTLLSPGMPAVRLPVGEHRVRFLWTGGPLRPWLALLPVAAWFLHRWRARRRGTTAPTGAGDAA